MRVAATRTPYEQEFFGSFSQKRILLLALAAFAPTPEADLATLRWSGGDPAATIARATRLADEFETQHRFALAAQAMSAAIEAATHTPDVALLGGLAARDLALCRAAREPACEARALLDLANAEGMSGRAEAALGRLRAAVERFGRAGDWEGVLAARYDAALSEGDLGDLDGALRDLRDIEPAYRRQAGARSVGFDISLSEVLLRLNKPEEALEAARRAQESSASATDKNGRFYAAQNEAVAAEALAGRALARLGRRAEAEAAFRHAFAAAGTPLDRFETEMAWAAALLDLGRAGDAVPVIERLAAPAHAAGEARERDFHELAARVYVGAFRPDLALRHETAASALQSSLYRASLAETVAESQTAIALAERQATTEHLEKERLAAQHRLERTRLAAAALVASLLSASVLGFAAVRARARRTRRAELAAERSRIVAGIHDTLLQGFVGVSMQVHAAAEAASGVQPELGTRLGRIALQASESLSEARRAMAKLDAPPDSIPGTLASIVGDWLQALDRPSNVALTFECDRNLPSLDGERTTALSHVVREAVTNALCHGNCSHIAVVLRRRGAALEACVRDDGRGFDPTAASAGPRDHWGLRLMRERMARIGGLLRISSAPARGTTVIARVPS